MYNIKQIEQLAQAYVKNKKDNVFRDLINVLIPVIDIQLKKNYQSVGEFWDDLRQETILKLYKNRKSLLTTTSTRLFLCLYNRIRDYLRTALKSGKAS